MSGSTLDQARSAKRRVLSTYEKLVEVVGVGITRDGDGYAVKVNVRQLVIGVDLPKNVDGVPVKVEVVGPISKR